MKNQDIVRLFEFVIQEVERLNVLRQKDWKKAAEEVGLDRGLPLNYDDFCNDYCECGKTASRQLFEMAATKLHETPELRDRVKVGTFLKPIEVEFARWALVKRAKIDEALVQNILREAVSRAKAKLEDRTYFFPVYTIAEEGVDEYEFGSAKFIKTRKFFADNEVQLKLSEESAVKEFPASNDDKDADYAKTHVAKLFGFAREHYGNYRWIACIEIKGAEPDMGWSKAREILEQSLGLLRLSVPSGRKQFIGLIEENTTLRSASYLSLKATKEFETWHSSSYAEPHTVPGFIRDFRQKVPQIVNVEIAIQKLQRWERPDAIEDRLLTSLFWFSEAWKESRLLPKIVKFSTSVESLFSTASDHEAITEKISERLAWLSFPGHNDWQERRNTYRTMKTVYAARSKAVHGDSAVKELNLAVLANQAEEQASLGIFAFAQLPPLFQGKQDKEKLLNEFFIRLKLEGYERAIQAFHEQ
jgi:hypothetical protein